MDLKQQTTAQDTGNLAAAIEKKLAYIEDRNNKLIKSLQVNADLEQEIRESAEQVKLLAKERQILVDSKKSALKSKEKMRRCVFHQFVLYLDNC